MFTWINKQGVQSDSGYVLQITGRFSAEYREAGRIMTIDLEFGFSGGSPCVIIGRDAFRHWDGDQIALGADEQTRLQANFRRACEFQQLKVIAED